jgi:hypothetical protein
MRRNLNVTVTLLPSGVLREDDCHIDTQADYPDTATTIKVSFDGTGTFPWRMEFSP